MTERPVDEVSYRTYQEEKELNFVNKKHKRLHSTARPEITIKNEETNQISLEPCFVKPKKPVWKRFPHVITEGVRKDL